MTEQSHEQEAPVKKPVKPKLVKVAAIKELPLPQETPQGAQFAMTVVTATFQQEDWPCTQEVYNWVKATRPAYKVHVDWVLTLDPVTGQVTHVTEMARPSSMPGFKQVGEETPKHVVISLYPNGAFAPTQIPERVSMSVVSEIQSLVADAEDPIQPGLKLGRYVVVGRQSNPGVTEIAVDPNPQQ